MTDKGKGRQVSFADDVEVKNGDGIESNLLPTNVTPSEVSDLSPEQQEALLLREWKKWTPKQQASVAQFIQEMEDEPIDVQIEMLTQVIEEQDLLSDVTAYEKDEANFHVEYSAPGGLVEVFKRLVDQVPSNVALKPASIREVIQTRHGTESISEEMIRALLKNPGGAAEMHAPMVTVEFCRSFFPRVKPFFVKGGDLVLGTVVSEAKHGMLSELLAWKKLVESWGGRFAFYFVTELDYYATMHDKALIVVGKKGRYCRLSMTANFGSRGTATEVAFAATLKEVSALPKSYETAWVFEGDLRDPNQQGWIRVKNYAKNLTEWRRYGYIVWVTDAFISGHLEPVPKGSLADFDEEAYEASYANEWKRKINPSKSRSTPAALSAKKRQRRVASSLAKPVGSSDPLLLPESAFSPLSEAERGDVQDIIDEQHEVVLSLKPKNTSTSADVLRKRREIRTQVQQANPRQTKSLPKSHTTTPKNAPSRTSRVPKPTGPAPKTRSRKPSNTVSSGPRAPPSRRSNGISTSTPSRTVARTSTSAFTGQSADFRQSDFAFRRRSESIDYSEVDSEDGFVTDDEESDSSRKTASIDTPSSTSHHPPSPASPSTRFASVTDSMSIDSSPVAGPSPKS